ncbi:MAG TPA: LanC-like protein [Solirubrobacteraceae bacterium]|nr:LanC-like protein [Solirubrobacteraceae bacterium]
MSPELYDPAEHRPLAGPPWSEDAARTAIAAITDDAIASYRGPHRLWPNHPADLDDDPADRIFRCIYLGAAGMAWGLDRLAGAGLADRWPAIDELATVLPGDYRADPELTELETGTPPPPPSLLFGESGILIACEAITANDGPDRQDELAATIATNARNETRELCWGSPGTMIAAEAMWRRTGDPRWRELWRDSALWLIEQWEDPVWVQDMYGDSSRYVGAGHGFASNASVLLSGLDLLGEEGDDLAERIITTTAGLAQRDGPLAQWPALADAEIERRPVQWCHGAPGIVTALASAPADWRIDGLLAAGAELTWRAGPLCKGVGLCHGTAGNAYALLALHHRTGDERWLERARAFAMDAAADVTAWRARHGQGRFTLFTGDLGVALLLADCLEDRARTRSSFPFLDHPLG